ncbi:hypothetical protein SADUNF_Sadunf18G0005000 [Salix dunnii]|uniref:Uncharacterized protein n=1 Tax=Salix dunnii TaxID=1413687 RepID=A0A835MLN0_9ROSI|nr:hypothetical protein SADUNF_Sadunf18G0005000 [Salix dunnii]
MEKGAVVVVHAEKQTQVKKEEERTSVLSKTDFSNLFGLSSVWVFHHSPKVSVFKIFIWG